MTPNACKTSPSHARLSLLLSCVAFAACTGDFLTPATTSGPKGNLATTVFDQQRPAERKVACEAGQAPLPLMPQLVRLSHRQYDNALRDLLGVTTSPSQNFSADPGTEGYDNNAFALIVSDTLARDYRRNAEDTAAAIAADPNQLAAVLGCAPAQGDACASAFIGRFVQKAYRRALTPAEASSYLALFKSASSIFDTGDMFANGARLVMEAALQSPHFLYRPQIGAAGSTLELDDSQIASQLAFMLWDSIPDDALLAAATAGALHTPEQIEAQARRMLDDAKARPAMRDFHDQTLHTDKFATLQKSGTKYPQFTQAVADTMKEEVRRFSEYVVFEAGGNVETLFTAPYTFVNASTAPFYGLSGNFPASGLVKADLDANVRAGLLTQVGFLSVNAHAADTSPIERGVQIQRDMLCNTIPPPPVDVDRTLPPLSPDIHTQRQRVEAVTAAQSCSGCHGRINPPGFSLESFDAVGRVQTTDNGYPVDTTGEMTIDGELVAFNNAVDVAKAVGASEQARRCYATKLVRYVYQRKESGEDLCTIDRITAQLESADYSIKQALVDIAKGKSFASHTVAGGTP